MVKLTQLIKESIEQHKRKVYLKAVIDMATAYSRRGYTQDEAIKDAAQGVKNVYGYELTPQDIEAVRHFVPVNPQFKEEEDFDLSDNPVGSSRPKKIIARLKKRDWVDSDAPIEIDGNDFNRWLREKYDESWDQIMERNSNETYWLNNAIESYVRDVYGYWNEKNEDDQIDWRELEATNRWFRVLGLKLKR